MSARARRAALALTATLALGAGLTPVAGASPATDVTVPAPDRAQLELVRDRVVAASAEAAADEVVNPIVTRTAGKDRYAVAANLSTFWSDYVWTEDWPADLPKVAFIASGHEFADALSGGALAANYGGPILLTRSSGLPTATKDALATLQPDYIVVLGGEGAVPFEVAEELIPYAAVGIDRVFGGDRYGTSAAMAESLVNPSPVAYVAVGTNWPDGLAGGAAAGADFGPLLLTKPGDVPSAVMEVLAETTQPEQIILLGGETTVTKAVFDELSTIAPVTRIAGSDRYITAAKLADTRPITHGATIATGLDWPDALSGSAFAGLVMDQVLLVRKATVPGATSSAVVRNQAVLIDLLGGTGAVTDDVVDALQALEVVIPE